MNLRLLDYRVMRTVFQPDDDLIQKIVDSKNISDLPIVFGYLFPDEEPFNEYYIHIQIELDLSEKEKEKAGLLAVDMLFRFETEIKIDDVQQKIIEDRVDEIKITYPYFRNYISDLFKISGFQQIHLPLIQIHDQIV
jgi:hypothetical protein